MVDFPCKAEMFQHPANKVIFSAIEKANYLDHPSNEIAITSALEAEGKLQTIGGPGTLNEILFTFLGPNPGQAGYFHQQLVEAQVARETLKVAQDNLGDLKRMKLSPLEFSEKIVTAAQGPQVPERCTLAQQLDGLLAELERTEPREAFSTGLPLLDLALDGGVHRGELLVVAGETSGGKSVLLAQAALACLQGGGKAGSTVFARNARTGHPEANGGQSRRIPHQKPQGNAHKARDGCS
jgi:replicative DNA helicase